MRLAATPCMRDRSNPPMAEILEATLPRACRGPPGGLRQPCSPTGWRQRQAHKKLPIDPGTPPAAIRVKRSITTFRRMVPRTATPTH
ncbi:hypothetical protein BKA16_001061 [Gordonia humi]|uniref:Uncharacterized protein n=1 Tax=Gordonia humi TaxID=686429 RepID=A0A840EZR2_9ACTN|nr:hypothetical protein [Gordonia humi]